MGTRNDSFCFDTGNLSVNNIIKLIHGYGNLRPRFNTDIFVNSLPLCKSFV